MTYYLTLFDGKKKSFEDENTSSTTYYLTLFDGKKKSFEEVEHVFNSLYHED
eukprot:CAMPEP_0113433706 /NCGR_PEP_ID=MMETSP0013_2-20120614/35083_1 /TAXON_ID=2843 ORGANISM="Skeletonema costatum, Strain 1716" /NCGR_SAMPLE_ID=MMETSP0013_2 /ASSEMBLY_ACC=CAM_ASM_000158 /LENGTH=51 /DNA_ID=CAMNT_0000323427 /DNA_START=10 /DNA_END=163 /DNA_ORIENTATION=- /assembly_acc=CAM_ASM_000158